MTKNNDALARVLLVVVAALAFAVTATWVAIRVVAFVSGEPCASGWADAIPVLAGWVMQLSGHGTNVVRVSATTVRPDGAVPVVAVAVAAVAAVGFAVLSATVRAGRTTADNSTGVRWAGLWVVRRLLVRAGGVRLVVGRMHRPVWRPLLAVEDRHSLFVLGPTQSRKTSGLVIPAVLEWRGPLVATSVKTDVVADTIARRRTIGDVLVFNPSGVSGLPSDGWDPVAACLTWADAQRMASWLVEAAGADSSKDLSGTERHFSDAAVSALAPMLYAAALMLADSADSARSDSADNVRGVSGISIVYGWTLALNVRDGQALILDNTTTQEVLSVLGRHEADNAASVFRSVLAKDDRERSGTISTLQNKLSVFGDPDVSASCANHTIDAETLFSGANTLYLVAPLHEQRRLRPLFEALLMTVVRTAQTRAAEHGPLSPAFLVALDEAANIAPLRELAQLAATGAGQGIQLLTVFQDFAQVKDLYGQSAATVINNHRAKVMLSGVADEESLKMFSTLIGDAAYEDSSVTVGGGGHSETTRTAYRSLAPAATLRQIKPGEGVLIHGHLPPVRIRLRWWRKTRALRALAKGTK